MRYPALEVLGVELDTLLAIVDDYSPTAVEEHADGVTVYFSDAGMRDAAGHAVGGADPTARITSREVDDEDWARRSQENLKPVTVGRLVIAPPWSVPLPTSRLRSSSFGAAGLTSNLPPSLFELRRGRPDLQPLVIAPSMGFGTGHHATTRLCLAALQDLALDGRLVLDVGTGSGILAMAARMLGAAEAVGIDFDQDAIQAASENLAMNPGIDHVRFLVGDLRELALPRAAVVTANLTGALLVQSAGILADALLPGGTLIVSGLLAQERGDVRHAFAARTRLVAEREEDGWLGLTFVAL